MNSTLSSRLYALALVVGVLPLWAGRHLPLVDLPQHLHLISVLHRLNDPTTLYPRLFEARNVLTPYLGYYYLVSGLSWLLPLELANRLFLTAYVVGLPLSLGFLLRSLQRPRWASLLALPFAYGDSLGWGFINSCVSLPLALLCLGLFVRALKEPDARARWSAWLSAALVVTLLFHIQAFAFVGAALPLLFATTATPDGPRIAARLPALAVLPSAALFILWVVARLGAPSEVAPGVPWKAWGPMLSRQNLAFLSPSENLNRLVPSLGNLLRDGSDLWGVYAVGGVALAATLLWAVHGGARGPWPETRLERLRLPGLALLAALLYFTLPFDIRGYLYYLNPRYAHLLAGLAVVAVPPLSAPWRPRLLVASALAVALTGVALARGVHQFQAEARPLDELAAKLGPRPVVMGLVYDTSSRIWTHPVFLHSAAFLAREAGGTSHFSFALQPHIPVRYKGQPPRAPVSEWRPDQFRYDEMGSDYSDFLVRGVRPERILGAPLARGELALVAQSSGWFLLRRTPPR